MSGSCAGIFLRNRWAARSLNVVSGVSLLGLRSGIISRIPDSSIGIFAKNKIRFCGVSDDYLVYDGSRNARMGVYYYENGAYPRKPGIVYDRQNSSMTRISTEEYPDSLYESARCFHTSGITLALSRECQKTGIEMIKKFKEHGAWISFDVNFRGTSGRERRRKNVSRGYCPTWIFSSAPRTRRA